MSREKLVEGKGEKRAVVLLSGGLDSSTILYYAISKGFKPDCLIFEYGQRHRKEIDCAMEIARHARCKHQLLKIPLPWSKSSSLLDKRQHLPERLEINPVKDKIPSTYVPARNIIFLSFAASCAEAIGAEAIFIGANAVDYSGYPDCRPDFFLAYQKALKKGLKASVEGKRIKIHVPLIHKTKAQIIKLGIKLNVPYRLTWSCYKGGKRPCGLCDSCLLRQRGFKAARIKDPV